MTGQEAELKAEKYRKKKNSKMVEKLGHDIYASTYGS
jgi:hypothetical protein